MHYRTRAATALFVSSLLAACGGGGGGGGASDQPAATSFNAAEGLWAVEASDGSEGVVAILEDGTTWGVSTNDAELSVIHGRSISSGNNFQASLTQFELVSSRIEQGSVSGTVTPRSRIDASSSAGVRLLLQYDADYERAASLADIAGTWAVPGGALTFGRDIGTGVAAVPSLTIDRSGGFSFAQGQCAVSGRVVPRPSGKNVFDLTASFTGTACALGNGTTTSGIALVATDGTEQALLAVALRPDQANGFIATGLKVGPVIVPAPPPTPDTPPAPPPPPLPPIAGLAWTATGPLDVWHSLSSSADGGVVVAGQAEPANPGASMLAVSNDAGQTWTEQTALGPDIWIASDVSANGSRIAAASLSGRLVVSNDRGATFMPVTLPAGLTAPAFESVTLSQDGSRIAAAVMNGPVLVGTLAVDGTATWINPAGLPASASWRSIDSSADASVLVAVAQDPAAFISTDGGVTWSPLAVSVGGSPVLDQNWYRVRLSGTGDTIAMVANGFGGASGNGIYVSKDRGQTFVRALNLMADYSGVAMSADGGTIAVTHSNNLNPGGGGQVLLSTNGGASFAPLAISVAGVPVAESNWRAVSMSADAARMAVAAGSFLTNTSGRIYVSSRTQP